MPMSCPIHCRCGGQKRNGRCDRCGVTKSGWRRDNGTRQSRGYDAQWQALRKAWLAEHPLCAECQRQGRVTPATQVDHVRPFAGLDDPLRLDWDNLQALCAACHMAKTARDRQR